MNWDDYQSKAMRTNANQATILHRLSTLGPRAMQLDNAARGLSDECGEVSSCVKKHIEYGQELDKVNLKEEVGDCLWRLSQLCDAAGLTLEKCAEGNIAKLKERYPESYTDHLAKEENRDRKIESSAIQGATITDRLMKEELDEPPNKPEGEGWKFGSPDVSGDMDFCYPDDVGAVTTWKGYVLGKEWGESSWWRVKPTECTCCPQITPIDTIPVPQANWGPLTDRLQQNLAVEESREAIDVTGCGFDLENSEGRIQTVPGVVESRLQQNKSKPQSVCCPNCMALPHEPHMDWCTLQRDGDR